MKPNKKQISIEHLTPPKKKGGALSPLSPMLRKTIEAFGVDALPVVIASKEKNKDGCHTIYQGIDTWKAACEYQLKEIPALLVPKESLSAHNEFTETEPEEVSRVKLVLKDLDYGLKPAEIAIKYKIDRTLVWHWKKLEKLIDVGWEMLQEKSITISAAREIARLPKTKQLHWLNIINEEKYSISQLKKQLCNKTEPTTAPETTQAEKDSNTLQLEVSISEKIGLPCEIDYKHNKGKITFQYHNLDELDNILIRLGLKELEEDW